jgi:hypothetical protein
MVEPWVEHFVRTVDRLGPSLMELDIGEDPNTDGVDLGGQGRPGGQQESRRLVEPLPGSRRRVLPDRARLMEPYQQQNMTVEQVAAEFGHSPEMIRQLLKGDDILRRRPERWPGVGRRPPSGQADGRGTGIGAGGPVWCR